MSTETALVRIAIILILAVVIVILIDKLAAA